ncbi:MAG: hypothetical protein IKS37_09385 [Solobacterium sp.]|nr:hypothetical protein [Solobacterium sp.]
MKKEDMLKAMNDLRDDFIEEAAPKSYLPKKKAPWYAWQNMRYALSAAFVLILALVITPMFGNRQPENPVTIARPFTDYTDVKEAQEEAGFTLTCPDKWKDASIYQYRVYESGILEAFYGSEDNTVMSVRKAKGDDDISGDYTAYDLNITVREDDLQGEFNGTNGLVKRMIWTDQKYSYAVLLDPGITQDEAEQLLHKIK